MTRSGHGVLAPKADDGLVNRVPPDGSPHRAPDQDPSLFEQSFELSPIGHAFLAPDGAWELVNPALATLLGADPSDPGSAMSPGLASVVHPDDRDQVRAHLSFAGCAAETTTPVPRTRCDVRLVRADATIVAVHLDLSILRKADGTSVVSMQVTDRSGEVAARDTLEDARARFEHLVANSTDAIVVLDEDGRMRYASPSIERLTGYPSEHFADRPADLLIHPDDLASSRRRIARLMETGDPLTMTCRVIHRDGSTRWFEATCSDHRADSAVDGIVANVRDVTARVNAMEAFRHQAMHDELTGLPNRTLLTDRILTAISRSIRSGSTFAVLFCDLDQFKRVNDTLGHDVGDALLVAVADRIESQVRAGDTVARLGGDEFVIVLEGLRPHFAAEDARASAAALIEAINRPIPAGGHTISIGASIGVTVHRPDESVKDLLRDADVALFTAKSRGRNRAAVYDGAMRAIAQHRFAMDALVRTALDGAGVVVEYQPIVELHSQRIVGAEALVRIDLDGVRHMPSDFIEAAEEAGTIVALGRQVLQRALAEAATWSPSTSISVNLSARQLADPVLPEIVIDALQVSGVEPSRLLLEVTETSLVDNNDLAIATMGRLHDLGVRIALDDFGTGWSSLAYLRRFPVSVVKIDRMFVEGATRPGSGDLEVIRAVIGLSHALGISVIAEGIETDLQAAVLTELGCSFGQGYLYGRPAPAAPLLRHGGLRIVPDRVEGVIRAG